MKELLFLFQTVDRYDKRTHIKRITDLEDRLCVYSGCKPRLNFEHIRSTVKHINSHTRHLNFTLMLPALIYQTEIEPN